MSRLVRVPFESTPIGVFRAVERPDYATLVQHQMLAAQECQGPGHLGALLPAGTTRQV